MEGIVISAKLFSEINKQINFELYSSYAYRAMAIYCKLKNFKGMAGWFEIQAGEEHSHAMKMCEHLLDRGYKVTLLKIDEPQSDFKSLLEVFEKTLAHEKAVTAKIHELYKMALAEEDYPAQVMLQWFISEQVEEEAHASEIVDKIKLLGEKSGSIFMLDHELGKRK